MIDDKDIKALNALHTRGQLRPSCVTVEGKAVVHSEYFVLEVPPSSVRVKKWPGAKDPVLARTWRDVQIPRAGGEKAQAMQVALDETDDQGERIKVIKLIGTTTERFMQTQIYELITRQFLRPEFRLYPNPREDGEISSIGVFDNGKGVGVVAAYMPERVRKR